MASGRSRPKSSRALFPTLRGSSREIGQDAIAEHQRRRFLGAMVAAVAEHGYPGTTIDELSALAGVSKRDFYAHFESKEACFLATFGDIVGGLLEQMPEPSGEAEAHDKLVQGLRIVAELISRDPDAASLVLVDSLSLGEVGAESRETSVEGFVTLLHNGFVQLPGGENVSKLAIRGMVFGLRRVCYHAIRDRNASRLHRWAPELASWALSYARERPAAAPSTVPSPPARGARGPTAAAKGSPAQRARIIAAARRTAIDLGFDSLTVAAISREAGTSNQTFYEHFSNKQEAVLFAFDELLEELLDAGARAYDSQSARADSIETATRAIVDQISDRSEFAQLGFIELPKIGRPALLRVDLAMGGLGELFTRAGSGNQPQIVVDAIGGGAWGVIRREVFEGRQEGLGEIVDDLADFVLVGLGER